MANIFLDIGHNAVVTATVPGSTTGSTTNAAGSSVDLVDVGGNYASAVQVVGTVTGTNPTLDTKIQYSTDGSSNWTDVTGATFTQVTTSTNAQIISFFAPARYVRGYVTVGGTTPVFPAGVAIFAQRHLAPANKGGFDLTAAAGNG